jgi:hypothetical protein
VNLHRLSARPAPELARALADFERRFTYPLGPGRSFRIDHGEDYPRFFRAIGAAVCFVAERQGRLLGSLAVALRQLALPDGTERPVAYLADLKIDPEARGGFTLLRLARAAEEVARPAGAAVSVVMEGTRATPTDYTGRLGIPTFDVLGRVAVLRLGTAGATAEEGPGSEEGSRETYSRLSRGRYASPGGTPAERSETAPTWLALPDRGACGLLEDTRRAKRLLADDGQELLSAHLSYFAYRTPAAAARLLRRALAEAARRGFPALFVAVPEADAPAVREQLGGREVVTAPAVVYGAGLAPGPDWNLNTAEI